MPGLFIIFPVDHGLHKVKQQGILLNRLEAGPQVVSALHVSELKLHRCDWKNSLKFKKKIFTQGYVLLVLERGKRTGVREGEREGGGEKERERERHRCEKH